MVGLEGVLGNGYDLLAVFDKALQDSMERGSGFHHAVIKGF